MDGPYQECPGPMDELTKNTLIPYVGRSKHALYHRQTFVRKLLLGLDIKAQTLLIFSNFLIRKTKQLSSNMKQKSWKLIRKQ